MRQIKKNHRNILSLGFVSFFNDFASEMIYPLLPLFLTTVLGAGPAILGVIEGIAEATASLLSLISGTISDRLRVRKPIFVFGYAFSNLIRPLIGLVTSWPALLALRFTDRLGKGIRGAPRDALLADSVSERRRGAAFGFQRSMDHAGAIVGPAIAAILMGSLNFGLKTVFLISAIPGLITVLIVLFAVREIKPQKVSQENNRFIAFGGFPANFYAYLACIFIFTIGNSSDAFLLLRAKDIGIIAAMIPLLWSVLHISKTAFSVLGGFASDHIGRKPTIIAGWLIYAAVYLGFGHMSTKLGIWVLFAVYGIFFGLTEGPQKAMVSDLTHASKRGVGYGLFNLIVSIAALPASVIFGVIWSKFGAQIAFDVGGILAIAASLMLIGVPGKNKRGGISTPLVSHIPRDNKS